MQMKNVLIRVYLLLIVATGTLRAQTGYWSPQMREIAEARSSRGWLYLKSNIHLTKETFIANYSELLGISKTSSLRMVKSSTDEAGVIHTHYEQFINGVQVVGTRISFHEQNNRLRLVSGQGAIPNAVGKGRLDEPTLRAAIIQHLRNKSILSIGPGEEIYLAERNEDRTMTAHHCMRYFVKEDQIRQSWYYIDIYTGKLIDKRDEYSACNIGTASTANYGSRSISTSVSGAQYRLLNDCYQEQLRVYNQNNDTLPWYFDYTDADNSWSSAASPGTQTLYCLSNTSSYFRIVNSRISMSGNPRTTIAMANCRFKDGNNWTGWGAFYSLDTLYFGSNGASLSDDLGVMDIVAHEYTHGVTHYASFLPYTKEMGAINESFSDIFGEIVENWVFSSNNWLVGTDCGTTLRSFINPNLHAQPSFYKGPYWHSTTGTTPQDSADNFGVHTNSGVQNYMFYLLVNGGVDTNALGKLVNVQPIGMLAARAIAYNALENYVGPFTDYPDARECWVAASDVLYGWCSYENMQVAKAWDAVGVIDNNIGELNVCGVYPYVATGGSIVNLAVAQSHLHVADSGCTVTVAATSPVEFKATHYIRFFPGFHAVAGSSLYAHLDSCSLTLWKPNAHPHEEEIPSEELADNRHTIQNFRATVSPNPFSNQLKITLELGSDNGGGLITISDGTGRLVMSERISSEGNAVYTYTPDITELPAGVYFATYQTENNIRWNAKLVKL